MVHVAGIADVDVLFEGIGDCSLLAVLSLYGKAGIAERLRDDADHIATVKQLADESEVLHVVALFD